MIAVVRDRNASRVYSSRKLSKAEKGATSETLRVIHVAYINIQPLLSMFGYERVFSDVAGYRSEQRLREKSRSAKDHYITVN